MPFLSGPHKNGIAREAQGFDVLEKAFQDAQFRRLDDRALRRSKWADRRDSVPTTYAEIPSSSDEDEGHEDAESLGQDEMEPESKEEVRPPHEVLQAGLKPARRLRTPPHLVNGDNILPPTPPTMANSDDNEPGPHIFALNQAFADSVRNALHAKQSGVDTPQQHLPTPEPSPPGTTGDLPSSQSQQSGLLHPLSMQCLRQYSSSRSESFYTAREDPSRSHHNLLSNTSSPEPRASPADWLQSRQPVRLNGLGLDIDGKKTPNITEHTQDTATPSGTRQHRTATPTSPACQRPNGSPQGTPESNLNLDHHISYIGSEEEAAPYFLHLGDRNMRNMAERPKLDANGYRERASAEDVNNEVYRQIQAANVKRHSNLGSGEGIPANIVINETLSKEHTLKRTAAHASLRKASIGSSSSQRDSAEVPEPLKLRKQRARGSPLQRSPDFATKVGGSAASTRSNVRAFTDPHGVRSPITKMTHEAMQHADEDQTRPMLRHASKKNRLENSPRAVSASESFRPHVPLKVASTINENRPKRSIRHFPRGAQLNHNPAVRRNSAGSRARSEASTEDISRQPSSEGEKHSFRHTAKSAQQTSGQSHIRNTSVGSGNGSLVASPGRASLDARLLHNTTTPASVSQMSDHTAIEVCEAKGVNIYPHNNDSLLVVQHGSRPASKGNLLPPSDGPLSSGTAQMIQATPLFEAHVQEPSPTLGARETFNQAHSPLTNPQAAPSPPIIKFIPPTPNYELENDPVNDNRPVPESRPSLKQRMRRFSESYIETPLFGRSMSFRRTNSTRMVSEPRPQNLSPLWQPRRFWDDTDSEDFDFEDIGDRLPPGGDTSSIDSQKRGLAIFPRSMSVRMPGFRGQGGFLLGNSLGLDRHGTNNRRHHVVVQRKTSSGGLHTGSGTSAYVSRGSALKKRASDEILRQMAGGKIKSGFVVPFSRGTVRWVGVKGFRGWIDKIRQEKEERERVRREAQGRPWTAQ